MKRAVLIIGAAFLWPALAQAELNYNYVQAGYVTGDAGSETIVREFSEVDIDAADYSGYALEASGTVLDYFLVQGEYTNVSLSDNEGDLAMGRLGLGGQIPLSDVASVYGTINYENYHTYYADGDGSGLTMGLRVKVMDKLEVQPAIGIMDYGTVKSDDGNEQGELEGWRTALRVSYDLTDYITFAADWRTYRLSVDQNDEGVGDADIEFDRELWFSLRYYLW